MRQYLFNEYVSSVLTEFGIENTIICVPDGDGLSQYNIVVKVDDDDLFFHTFAEMEEFSNVRNFYCYFDKSNREFFDMDLSKYYDIQHFNSSSFRYSSITLDVENEIKKSAKEHIIQTLKQLKLIE